MELLQREEMAHLRIVLYLRRAEVAVGLIAQTRLAMAVEVEIW